MRIDTKILSNFPKIPGVVIAGTSSGVGKTTISLGIIYGLLSRGYTVQPFKIGPDYIDPSYHNVLSKRKSRNLDIWLMGKQGLIDSYIKNSIDTDFTVLEGVMGLYDGLSGKNNFASTAHISKILGLPIILIIDAKKAARSLAAVILGFLKFEPKIRIIGIIINNLSSARHLKYIKEAIDTKTKLPILGSIFRKPKSSYMERHLGLIPSLELDRYNKQKIINDARKISGDLNLDEIIRLGQMHSQYAKSNLSNNILQNKELKKNFTSSQTTSKVKILVALDKSFNFYYQDTLDDLAGQTSIQFFSPIDDKEIPHDCSGIILGGGFPEVIADKLEENAHLRKKIFNLMEDGMPVHAECGGLMYLTKSISGFRDSKKKYRMVGFFDAETKMTGKLTLGYTEGLISQQHPFFKGVKNVKGHEFHYSDVTVNSNDSKMLYDLKRGNGINDGKDGLYEKNCLASYMHSFIAGKRSENFVKCCIKYSKS
ncbi:MAG TPA: cobyrinate a,c-diamide synthase [Candidatus Nitrosocosmicus sp.]|nr:cobyrinate a,c-diamide synthase [Candidatus Nitrosocosmicus sp.]